jgi:prepilin-type processing-associated H-X9-DG protein
VKLHSSGSNIVFVDGHVKTFPAPLMPKDDQLVWVETTKQWWNTADPNTRQIAINP